MKLNDIINKYVFWAMFGLLLIFLVFQFINNGIGVYGLDDAYIIDHAVVGILGGRETRFIGSTAWQGITSPAYVVAIILLTPFFSVQVAHWLVSTLSILLLVYGWYVIFKRASLNGAVASAVIIIALSTGTSFAQLTNGLETGMAMAALTWVLIALEQKNIPIWGYILISVLFFIRPEFLALSIFCAFYIAIQRPTGWLKGLTLSLIVFLICLGTLYVFSGSLISNTVSAKAYFFAEGCLPALQKADIVLRGFLGFIFGLNIFALGFIMMANSKLRWVLLSFVMIFIFAYFLRLPGALFHNDFRYLYIMLPIAVFGWATRFSHKDKSVRQKTLALGIVAFFSALLLQVLSTSLFSEKTRDNVSDDLDAAKWVADHVPHNAIVMVHDAGAISQFGEQTLVDLVGLKSPYSMTVHQRTTFKMCQRLPSAISEIANHSGATYIVVTNDWDEIFGLTQSLAMTGWTVERVDGERGDSFYKVYHITNSSSSMTGKNL